MKNRAEWFCLVNSDPTEVPVLSMGAASLQVRHRQTQRVEHNAGRSHLETGPWDGRQVAPRHMT